MATVRAAEPPSPASISHWWQDWGRQGPACVVTETNPWCTYCYPHSENEETEASEEWITRLSPPSLSPEESLSEDVARRWPPMSQRERPCPKWTCPSLGLGLQASKTVTVELRVLGELTRTASWQARVWDLLETLCTSKAGQNEVRNWDELLTVFAVGVQSDGKTDVVSEWGAPHKSLFPQSSDWVPSARPSTAFTPESQRLAERSERQHQGAMAESLCLLLRRL